MPARNAAPETIPITKALTVYTLFPATAWKSAVKIPPNGMSSRVFVTIPSFELFFVMYCLYFFYI